LIISYLLSRKPEPNRNRTETEWKPKRNRTKTELKPKHNQNKTKRKASRVRAMDVDKEVNIYSNIFTMDVDVEKENVNNVGVKNAVKEFSLNFYNLTG
ncbi:MAG: hypothetical protein K2K81_10375, partial [Muribaculaceae bacterium]|nr:hypothetical protein [Muribaculaceae bacterium]